MSFPSRIVVRLIWLIAVWAFSILMTGCRWQTRAQQKMSHEEILSELLSKAQIQFSNGDFLQAASLYRRGVFVCDSLKLSSSEYIPYYNGLAQVHIRFADYSNALRYSNLALSSLTEQTSPRLAFQTWNTRCNTYFYRQEYEKALPCAMKSKQMAAQDSALLLNYHVAMINEADILTRMNHYDGVAQMLDSCESLFVQHGFESAIHYTTSLRGLYALRAEHDFQKAGEYLLKEPMMVSDQTMNYVRVENLREYYKAKGDLQNAFNIDEFLLGTKDSLLNNTASMRVADLELQYKDWMREMELLNSLRREHFYLVVSTCAIIILFLVAIIVIYHTRSVRRRRDLALSQMHETLMAEKVRNIRSRISPHYMMNVLRQLGNVDDAPFQNEKIQLLTQTLRSSLELSDQAVVCMKREVDFVQDYLKLVPRNCPVTWKVDSEVDLWQTMIPSMIIQLPVENALKYAYEEGGPIDVSISRKERNGMEGVLIAIEDYGKGMPQGVSISPSGLGLAILTRTISFINMFNNNEPLDMHVFDKGLRGQGHGVRVEFFIPKLWKSPFLS